MFSSRTLFVFFISFLLSSQVCNATPNIVFLLIDDMGWPDVACYGHEFHETPNIDRLAAQGMRFTDFYAASPVCSSTRCSIQSGQYPARVGITDFIPGHWRPFEKLVVPPIENELPAQLKTPGDALRAAGYKTAYFGKWHLGNGPKWHPDQRGYEVTEKQLGPDFKTWRGDRPAGPKKIDLLTDQTLYFIEKNQENPFFVTLSHHAVHIRVEAEPETVAKYEAKAKPPTGINNPRYAAMVEDLDRSIGRIMDRLDELKLSENTVIVFASDNGGLRMIYTQLGEIVSTNSPLRDEKGTIYEGGIRVPLIVRWPGVVASNTFCEEPTTTADLLPTFCEISAATVPEQPMDGSSLMPLLRKSTASLDRDAIYFHYPHYHHSAPSGAIRMGNLKMIEYFDGSPPELYNLKTDLSETKNLAAEMPDKLRHMQKKLAEWRSSVGARMPTENPEYDAVKANQWWNRRSNKPLDIEAMRKRYESSIKKAS